MPADELIQAALNSENPDTLGCLFDSHTPNCLDPNGCFMQDPHKGLSYLAYCAMQGKKTSFQQLLNYGADPQKDLHDLLWLGLLSTRTEFIRYLVEIDIERLQELENSIVHLRIAESFSTHRPGVKLFLLKNAVELQRKSSRSLTNTRNKTPFDYALAKADPWLLEFTIRLLAIDLKQSNCLLDALELLQFKHPGLPGVIEILLSHHCDPLHEDEVYVSVLDKFLMKMTDVLQQHQTDAYPNIVRMLEVFYRHKPSYQEQYKGQQAFEVYYDSHIQTIVFANLARQALQQGELDIVKSLATLAPHIKPFYMAEDANIRKAYNKITRPLVTARRSKQFRLPEASFFSDKSAIVSKQSTKKTRTSLPKTRHRFALQK